MSRRVINFYAHPYSFPRVSGDEPNEPMAVMMPP